jgi:uncharacterized membrane protein YciS (DUF1049 family)
MKNIVKNSQFFGLFISLVGFLVAFAMGAQASNYAKPDFLLLTTFFGLSSLFFITAYLCSPEN